MPINTRRDALMAMDFHSRCTTAPYRAPELWDISSSGTTLTRGSDAFSLGCVLYFMLFGKPAFEFNVGKPVLPQGVLYFGNFVTELALSLLINDPAKRMTVEGCRDAMENKAIPDEAKKHLEDEFKTELKRERGDFNASSATKKKKKPAPAMNFADFDQASFGSVPTSLPDTAPKPQQQQKKRNSIDEWGSFQGSPSQPSDPPAHEPKSLSPKASQRRKGPVKMLRPRGWGMNGRKVRVCEERTLCLLCSSGHGANVMNYSSFAPRFTRCCRSSS